MHQHPTKDELSGFILGKLPPETTDAVADHVDHCPPCQDTIHDLEAHKDTLLRGLQAKPPASIDGDEECRRVVERASEIGAPTTAGGGSKPKAAPAPAASQKEHVFGDYVVLGKIGAGGMGQVYKARHRRMDRIVALKVLAKSAMNSPDAVRRFEREAKAAARLIHPNIVTAFDAGEQGGLHFLVMEFVDGGDLAGLVKSQGPLPVDKAVDYVLQTARGLEYAHAEGVVHRDIKPANLLLDKKGVVKILDMGLARLDDAMGGGGGVQDGLTQSGQVMGTVDYMAPEQAVDTRTAGAKADVYALGCTLHRLLVGENVYGGETLVQKLLAHRENPIPSIVAKRPDVPKALDEIFRKMVAKRPEDRMQSMREVIDALEELVRALKQLEADVTARSEAPAAFVIAETKPVGRKSTSTTKPKQASGGKKPPTSVLVASAAAAFFFIALGVWLLVRDKDGNEVARVQVPEGGSIVVDQAKPATPIAKSAPTGATRVAPQPSFFTQTPAPTPTTAPQNAPTYGFALDFDGTASHVVTPIRYEDSHPITIEGFVTLRASQSTNWIFSNTSTSAGGMSLRYQNGWIFSCGNGVEEKTTFTVAPDGVSGVRHFAVVFDGSIVSFYVDGIRKESRPARCSKTVFTFVVGGAQGAQAKNYFNGTIDEVRFSRVARYTGNFTPQPRHAPDADTLALYHFDEGTGDVLHDASGNKHDGKIVGAKWVRADGSPIPATTAITTSDAPSSLRWPLAPSKPEDILFFHNLGADIFIRRDAEKDWKIRPKDPLPPKLGTIVGLDFWETDATKIDYNALRRLGSLADLESLHLAFKSGSADRLSDVSRAELGKLTQLRFFTAGGIGGSETDPYPYLLSLPQLERLHLKERAPVDWARTAGRIPTLREIYVYRCGLTDDELKNDLDKLPRLEELRMNGVQCTDEALRAFAARHPWCRIIREDGSKLTIEPTAPPPGDYALALDGTASCVSVPSLAAFDGQHSQPLTFEAYVTPKRIATAQDPSEQQVLGWQWNGGSLNLALIFSSWSATKNNPTAKHRRVSDHGSAVVDKRIHLAQVWDGKKLMLYLDGMPVPQPEAISAPTSGAPGFVLGKFFVTKHFQGLMNEVRISTTARYDKAFTPLARHVADADTLALYHFDEGAGDVLRDASGNGHDGKIVGATWVRADGSPIIGTERSGYIADLSGTGSEKITTYMQSAFQQWVKETQALPADKQLDAVAKKLMELNPGFDGTLANRDNERDSSPRIDKGVVTELGFFSDQVVDLSPVRALSGLKLLNCCGRRQGTGRLADLSPLSGLTLTTLYCFNTEVADLSPLSDVPLKSLFCFGTPITNLAPLAGVPLEDLRCHDTSVSDLSSLAGMQLKTLRFTPGNITRGLDVIRGMTSIQSFGLKHDSSPTYPAAEFWKRYDAGEFGKPNSPTSKTWDTPEFRQWVKDTQALPAEQQIEAVGKKLMELNPGFDGKLTGVTSGSNPKIENGRVTQIGIFDDNVTDLSPFRALADLTALRFNTVARGQSKLSDLSPLQGMGLKQLLFQGTKISDLSPLRGMSLTTFDADDCSQLRDLSPIQGMPLTDVRLEDTKVSNLSPLAGMPIATLKINYTPVADLSPLRGMPLTSLQTHHNQVTDLSPLAGMSLNKLTCHDNKITDLSPLKDVRIKELTCDFVAQRDAAILRSISTLETINGKPAADFWKEVDADGSEGKKE